MGGGGPGGIVHIEQGGVGRVIEPVQKVHLPLSGAALVISYTPPPPLLSPAPIFDS